MLPLGGVPSHDDLVLEVVDHGAGDQRVGRDDVQGGEEDDDVKRGHGGQRGVRALSGEPEKGGGCMGVHVVIDFKQHINYTYIAFLSVSVVHY